jgi:predicted enzyme related to lactoylglutathione lyase
MSERTHYPAGVPCWVDTLQPNPEAAKQFYGDVFGWEFIAPGQMPGTPPGKYFVAQLRGHDVAGIASQPEGVPASTAWNTHIAVDSVDATCAKILSTGGTVLVAPFDARPAGRMAVVSDPAGAVFCIWEANDRRGAQLVNEPSAWAMNVLTTRDSEGEALLRRGVRLAYRYRRGRRNADYALAPAWIRRRRAATTGPAGRCRRHGSAERFDQTSSAALERRFLDR